MRFRLPGRPARRLALVFLLAFLVLASYKLWHIYSLVVDIANQARTLDNGGESSRLLSPENSAHVGASLSALSGDFSALRTEAGPFLPLAPLFGWLPAVGGDVSQAPALVDLGQNLSVGASAAFSLLSQVSAAVDANSDPGRPIGQKLIGALSGRSDEIGRITASLESARAARRRVVVSSLSERTRSYVERIDRLLPQALGAAHGLALLPILLGADRPRDYLLLVQNSDELRATGGFVSSVVRVHVANGDFQLVESVDSYSVDNPKAPHPEPPAALRRYMETTTWYIRDSNWSPDFPTAARDAARLYALDRDVTVDGVIAANLSLVPRLLEATGPVQVPGYGETVDLENAIAKLQAYWASPLGQGQSEDWWGHRKDFSGALLATMLDRVRTGEVDRVALVAVLSDALASRELLLYLADPEAQSQVDAAGWAGAVSSATSDAVMVVDSNLGFNKVDPNISRSVNLEVKLNADGSGRSIVRLGYKNLSADTRSLCELQAAYPPTYAEMQQGCYWDYVRLVASPGARLVSTSFGDEEIPEPLIGLRTVPSGYLVVPRGQSRDVEFDYDSPRLVMGGRTYQLEIEKQPGARSVPWKVAIALPPGWAGYRADPLPNRVNGNVLEYDITLDRDWQLTIQRQDYGSNLASGLALGGLALISVGAIWLLHKSPAPLRGRA